MIEIGKLYKPKHNQCGIWKSYPSARFVKVTEVDERRFYYDVLDQDFNKLDWCFDCFKEGDLIPVEEEKPKTKFQVGDRVKVISKDGPTHFRNIGDEGEIIKINGSKQPYQVKFNDSPTAQWFDPEQIEKIEESSQCSTSSPEPITISSETIKEAISNLHFKIDVAEPVYGYKPFYSLLTPYIKEPKAQKATKSMSVIKALKAKLSSTDRTLVKHGYLTNTGERTSSYESELWDAVKARLIDLEDTAEFRTELAKALKDENED